MNYKATFDFSKKESAYIAGSVYFVSMILSPVFGLAVVSQIDAKTNSSVEIVIKAATGTGIDIVDNLQVCIIICDVPNAVRASHEEMS